MTVKDLITIINRIEHNAPDLLDTSLGFDVLTFVATWEDVQEKALNDTIKETIDILKGGLTGYQPTYNKPPSPF